MSWLTDMGTKRDGRIVIVTHPKVRCYLEQLVRTGLYGNTAEEAAEELVLIELRRLLADGWVRRV